MATKKRAKKADYTQRKKISRATKEAKANKKMSPDAPAAVPPCLTIDQRRLGKTFRLADAAQQKAAYVDNRSPGAKRSKVPTPEGTKEAEEARVEERKALFLETFVDINVSFGTIFQACKYLCTLGHAGIGPQTVRRWRKADPVFAEEFVEALASLDEQIDAETVRRAVMGWEEPVFGSLGEGLGSGEVGRIQKFSDPLLIDIRKARRQFGQPSQSKKPPANGASERGELTDSQRIAELTALTNSIRTRVVGQNPDSAKEMESDI